MEDPSSSQTQESSENAVDNSQEMPIPSGSSLPRNVLYLAIAEVFMAFGVWLNTRSLMVNLFGLNPEQTAMLDTSMGLVWATILTGLVTIDWTVQVLCMGSAFHVLLISWMLMPSATCFTCPLLAPVLSMFTSTLEPIRLAFISDQLTPAEPSYIRPFFSFIAGSWFMGITVAQFVTFSLEGPTMAPLVIGMILTVFILYIALVVFIQTNQKHNRDVYCHRPIKFAAIEIYRTHEGKKYWDMLHIGITLTGHHAAQLILDLAQKEQYRSIIYAGNLPGIAQSVVIAIPAILAVVIIIIIGFGVTPLLKRFNREITDLQYIGLGMIAGCISMIMALLIQTYIDVELKPPHRQECLLFLFNLLPSKTTFESKAFGKQDNAFIQVGGTTSTAFLSKNVADIDEYPISVINLQEHTYEEDVIHLIEGTIVSYVVTRGEFKPVLGLDLHTHHFMRQDSTFYLGCAVNSTVCEGKEIKFLSTEWIYEDTLPPRDKFKAVILRDGNYTIKANVDGSVTTLTSNFTTNINKIHAGIVYDVEPGVPDIAIFFISAPQIFPIWMYVLQQIMIAFREAFFTLGLLRFLYYQTRPNHPARPFIYSAFFFIYKGVPLIVVGGLRASIFNFLEAFVVHVFLIYYACGTALFILLANKFEHSTWLDDDDEKD